MNNGVNAEALPGAREALTATPEAARFNWRANCTWVNGTHSSIFFEKFFGLGEEQNHRQVYTFGADHPQIFASEDNGITPPEYILVGLSFAGYPKIRGADKGYVGSTFLTGVDEFRRYSASGLQTLIVFIQQE